MPAIYENYYATRGVTDYDKTETELPNYVTDHLPADKQAPILDIGCGYGAALGALRKLGYTNLEGVDVSPDAVDHCKAQGLSVSLIRSIDEVVRPASSKFAFILMTHVLEHIPKARTIPTLNHIREALLAPNGTYYVAVPNAQSNTGCYWAYEDFTHETLFTAGSLLFVLRRAGFDHVELLDPNGLAHGSRWKRPVRKLLLSLYRRNLEFWNNVTRSSFHAPSPAIFTFELKAVAKDTNSQKPVSEPCTQSN